jgi:uncharacterized zinc-type alcohol dehydrogenase-like protein
VGIVGVGGLGTMGIKIANALGHQVVAISTSANKEEISKKEPIISLSHQTQNL